MAKKTVNNFVVDEILDGLETVSRVIDSAGPRELLEAERQAKDKQHDFGLSASQRKMWGMFASVLRLSAR